MNEDERGITPASETSITIDRSGCDWWVIIEQGNGAVIKEITLTDMERLQLSMMFGHDLGKVDVDSCSFLDLGR